MEPAVNTTKVRKSSSTSKNQNRPIVDKISKVYRASSARTEESQRPKNKSQYQHCSEYQRYPVRPKRTEQETGNRPTEDKRPNRSYPQNKNSEERQTQRKKVPYHKQAEKRRPPRREQAAGNTNSVDSADSSQGKAKTEAPQNPPEETKEKPVFVDAPPPAFNIWTVRMQMQTINEERARALEPKPQRTNRRYFSPSPVSPEPEQTQGWEEVKPRKTKTVPKGSSENNNQKNRKGGDRRQKPSQHKEKEQESKPSDKSSQGKTKTEAPQTPPEEKKEKPVLIDAPQPKVNIWAVRKQKIEEERVANQGWVEVTPKKNRINSTPKAKPPTKKEAEDTNNKKKVGGAKRVPDQPKGKEQRKGTKTPQTPSEEKTEKPVLIDAPQPNVNIWAVRKQKMEEERVANQEWETVTPKQKNRTNSSPVAGPSTKKEAEESRPQTKDIKKKKVGGEKRFNDQQKGKEQSIEKGTKTKTKAPEAPPEEKKERPVLIDAPQPKVNFWAVRIQKKEEERAEGWEEVKSRKKIRGSLINPSESWPSLDQTLTKEGQQQKEPKRTQASPSSSQTKTKTESPQQKTEDNPVLVNAPQPKVNIWAVRKEKIEESQAANQGWEEVKPKKKIRTNSTSAASPSAKKEAEEKKPEEPKRTQINAKGSHKKSKTKAPPKEQREKPYYVDAALPSFNAWTVRTQMQKMNVQATAISPTPNPEQAKTSAPLVQSQKQKKAVARGPLRREPAVPRTQAIAKCSQTKSKVLPKEKKERTYRIDAAHPSFNAWTVRTQVQKMNEQKARVQAKVQAPKSNPEPTSAQKPKIDGHGLLCETCYSFFCICKAGEKANAQAAAKSQEPPSIPAPSQMSALWCPRRERPKSQSTNQKNTPQSGEQEEAAGDGPSKITVQEPPVASGSTSNPEPNEAGASAQSKEESQLQKKQVNVIPGCEAWAKAKASSAQLTQRAASIPTKEDIKSYPKNNGIGSSSSPKAGIGPASAQRWETVKYGKKNKASQVNVIPGSQAWANAKASQAPVIQRKAPNPTNHQEETKYNPKNNGPQRINGQEPKSNAALKQARGPATSQRDLGARPKVRIQDEPRQQGKNKRQGKGFEMMKFELEVDNESGTDRSSKGKTKTKPSQIPKKETPKAEFIPAPQPKVNAWVVQKNLSPNTTQKIPVSAFPPLPTTTSI